MNVFSKNIIIIVSILVVSTLTSYSISAKKIDKTFDGIGVDTAYLNEINNYWVLVIDDVFSYQADSEDGCEFNVLWVTNETHEVNGITNRVVLDREWLLEDVECDDVGESNIEDAILAEYTADFYAQDKDGNIWYFGENTWSQCDEEEPEFCVDKNGIAVGDGGIAPYGDPSGSWWSGEGEDVGEGIDNAVEGIVMLSNPRKGDRYQQEYWEDQAEDWGAVLRLSSKVEAYENEMCLKTKEWTPLESGHIEHKYYCNGVLVFIEELHGKTVQVNLVETLDDLPCMDIDEMFTDGIQNYNDDDFTEIALTKLAECSAE